MKSFLFGKLAALVAVAAALLLGLNAVEGVVRERQERRLEAEQNVARSVAGEQTLTGPMLRRQCEQTRPLVEGTGASARKVSERKTFVQILWPHRLSVTTRATVEPRYRGLFKIDGYLADSTLSAEWRPEDVRLPVADDPQGTVACQPADLVLALGDVRGVRSADVVVDGVEREVQSGIAPDDKAGGLHANLPGTLAGAGAVHAVVHLSLAGTASLAWTPVGDESTVEITSDWPHPSFAGQFLPVEREVGPQGFKARWRVSALASGAQRQYRADGAACGLRDGQGDDSRGRAPSGCTDSFGVRFFDPVNPYVLGDRALKYGVLFIALTFIGVALVELTRRLKVHPVQYLLVGCAQTVFFLLLVSLSEHIGFGPAYACAASACAGLLAFYGAHVLAGRRAGLVFGAAIGVLYGALYLLLQQEQTALVLGSLLLFLAIATVMFVTRKIDWYTLAGGPAGPR